MTGIVSKTGIIIGVLLIVTVVATIIMTTPPQEETEEPWWTEYEEGTETEDSEGKDNGLAEESDEEEGISEEQEETITELTAEEIDTLLAQCAGQAEGTQKDYCIQELAVSKKRSKLCEHLTVFSKDDCVKDVAIEQNNEKTCEEIDSNSIRNNCFLPIALNKSDGEICKKIKAKGVNEVQKWDECFKTIAERNNEAKYCRYLSGSYTQGMLVKDNCYWNIMIDTRDSSLCENIRNTGDKEDCFEYWGERIEEVEEELSLTVCSSLVEGEQFNCFIDLAIEDNNYLVCNYLLDENHNSCMYSLIDEIDEATATEFCEEILWVNKNDCYKKMALEKEDGNLCALISDTSTRGECYYDVAIESNNAELCKEYKKNIIRPLGRDNCYRVIALETKHAELCENIQSSQKYYGCYYDVAIELKSYNICTLIERITHVYSYSRYPLQQMCYKNYAIEIGNEEVCDFVIDVNLNKSCIDGNANYGVIHEIN